LRPFIVTAYVSGDDGRMIPERPRACPWAPTSDGCRIDVEHWRPRKTGPEHPLLVVSCRDHGRAFTLYPCGHVPYGRVAIAPVREDGTPLRDTNWAVTVFDAAIDARANQLWQRERPEHREIAADEHHRRTQGRWLERCELLLGVRPVLSISAQSMIADRLGVSTLELRDVQRMLEGKKRVQERGDLVFELLAKITVRPSTLDAMLIAGALAGAWGPPIRWEHTRGRRRFLLPQTGAPP
jgi:hypothetical protein